MFCSQSRSNICNAAVWDSLGQCGTAWDSLGQPGSAWDSLRQHGTVWDSLGQHGTVGQLGSAWDSLGQHGTVWDSLGSLGQHGVDNADFTHTDGPGLIPGASRKESIWPHLADRIDFSSRSINNYFKIDFPLPLHPMGK